MFYKVLDLFVPHLFRVAVVAVALITLFVESLYAVPPFQQVQRPANDDYARAQPILGASGVVNGTNVNATKETNEPNHAGASAGASVWFRWLAPANGRFVFTTARSAFPTVLAVYTGTNLPATFVKANDVEPLGCTVPGETAQSSRLSFDAVQGTVYNIVVDTRSASNTGAIILRWGRSATISGAIISVDGNRGPVTGVELGGDTCRKTEATQGQILFTDVPTGGRYDVLIEPRGFAFTPFSTNQSISPLTGNVSNFNFYLSSPTVSIQGRVRMADKNNLPGVTVSCAATGSTNLFPPKIVPVDAFTGDYTCSSLPIFTVYVVTPVKLGFRFIDPSETLQITDRSLTDLDFDGLAAGPYTITGQVTHANGTTGVSGVTVALTGSQTASTVTNATGNYSFTEIPHGGNYTVTPSSANFTFNAANLSFNNLSGPQTANFTASFILQLLLDDVGQVGALDSVLLLRDPFPVINNSNQLNRIDNKTRVAIFLSTFQLGPGELPSSVVINLVGSNSQSYDIPAEDVRPLIGGLTRVTFSLPESLTAGTCTLIVKARGLTSNLGPMRIK